MMCRAYNKEKMWVRGWEMRGEEKPDNAVDTAERAGMKKRWKAKAVSTVGTRMEMTAEGCRKLSKTTVLIAVMLCQSIIQCYSFYGEGGVGWGGAYKSMSWSTSSRERAKLGRLDSEPPLLLREWPPETGRRDKGEKAGKQRGGEAEERESQQANSSQGRGREVKKEREEREKKRAKFTHLPLLVLKNS